MRCNCPSPSTCAAAGETRLTRARLAATGRTILFVLVSSVIWTSDLRAQDRAVRQFDHEIGIKEEDGILWLPTTTGVTRVPPVARFGEQRLPRVVAVAPWYRQGSSLVAFALLAFALLAVVYRARIEVLLELERQRTLLAMDLHDEVGSGLASISILSELAANGADDVERKALVSEISTTSRDLSSALSDLVWSLDRRPSMLKDLADRLADHGARLFSNRCTCFNVRLPESWPSTPVAFPVRRGVLLIGLEALHNTARHSGARAVTLSLEPQGTDWRLMIEDDGVGLPAGVFDRRDDSGGLGLRSTRERARTIGAEIEWRSGPDQGTAVILRFDLRGRPGRRLPRIRRGLPLVARASRLA